VVTTGLCLTIYRRQMRLDGLRFPVSEAIINKSRFATLEERQ
jgi:hypothetical protein